MRSLFLIASLLITLSALAGTSDKVGTRWAYYGEEFYTRLTSKKLDKDFINSVLNSPHLPVKGGFDKIGQCIGQCYRHISVGYDEARKILFGEIQKEVDNRGTYVEDVYCGKKFHYRNLNDVSRMHTEVNIEHTWPQSKFSGRYEKGMQKSDLHHLYLTDSLANNRRGNHEFGIAGNRVNELNVQNCSISKLVEDGGDMIFQPPTFHRGNVARSLFYFAVRYNMPITRDQEKALRQWHKEDPIDAEEIERHEIVVKHQMVRNPFIDHPELVDLIKDF